MKSVVVLAVLIALAVALPKRERVDDCDNSICKLPKCQCARTYWEHPGNKPQFVVLSFEDAVSEASYNQFISRMLLSRRNPDGCAISGTFFVPHEYTNYSIINKLYGHGFEIASHSITKNYSQEYWRNASVSTLSAEFAGQRTILYTFANIPYANITGVRVPQLQLNGNTFRALSEAGFKYDASWPTQQPWTWYPYTLDYTTLQACHTVECHVESVPGLWEMPIVDWTDRRGISCNSVEACAVKENISDWMIENYKNIEKSGAPISLRLSYSWFLADQKNAQALNEFLNYIRTQRNTYIVSYKQVLEWSEDPSKKFTTCRPRIDPPVCVPKNCNYTHENVEHVLNVCGTCPQNYPWIHNPTGQ